MERDDHPTTFAELFERAAGYDVDEDAIRSVLAERRTGTRNRSDDGGGGEGPDDDGDRDDRDAESDRDTTGPAGSNVTGRPDPSPARVVADADVLAADLLVGGDARAALDVLRSHSWTTLVASDALLADATAVIASVADEGLAADWRRTISRWREPVDHPAGDHPALASAYRGGAMQVVTLDPSLTGARTAAGLRKRLPVSVRDPHAFAAVFSPERLYPSAVGGSYPGPDREPR
ncbi:hypothetical protein [Halorubrum sp. JWXQ-INN 858]|uniref:DUF7384 family protein n=1 Tax=Halorubrum sp. JWXQ-INN 858 TaxID=2690782 RepID=UPI002AA2B488|nr:hypothetical protein [Halorubrum sp. JWXQ-INN 858]